MANEIVSICIPTYNGGKYLAEAMDSAINQTYKNLEIIISDDHSSDNTLSIVESFINKTTIPIKIYNHEPNGIGNNWNNCLFYSTGKYIKFLFQDDILDPVCVEEMVKVIKGDNNIGLVASKREFIVEEVYSSSKTNKWIKKYGDLQENLNLENSNGISILTKNIFKSQSFFNSPLNKIGEPSVFLFEKEIVEEVGNFREDLKQILDFEFCYRVLKKKNIAIIDSKLVKFRLHSQQATNVNRGNDKTDFKKYNKIIYGEYFWLVSNKKKLELIIKNNLFIQLLLGVKRLYIKILF